MRFTHLLAGASLCAASVLTSCLADDAPASESTTPESGDEHVLAVLEHPTADGRGRYLFRFVEADGTIATLVGTPQGYPAPVDDDCVLDTFLRVAPDDMLVPVELRRACGDDDATPRQVVELRPPGLAFEVQPITAAATEPVGPFCAPPGYKSRYDKLVEAAKYRPVIPDCDAVCDVEAYWDVFSNTCAVYDAHDGNLLGTCSASEIAEQCVESPCCIDGHIECQAILDPACAHDVVGLGNYGPWNVWEGNTGLGASKLQAEVSACDPQGTTAIFWKMRHTINDAWGPPHNFMVAGGYWYVLKLDAGTAQGKYRGNQYIVHANGNAVRAMFVSATMEGINRAQCPLPFPL